MLKQLIPRVFWRTPVTAGLFVEKSPGVRWSLSFATLDR